MNEVTKTNPSSLELPESIWFKTNPIVQTMMQIQNKSKTFATFKIFVRFNICISYQFIEEKTPSKNWILKMQIHKSTNYIKIRPKKVEKSDLIIYRSMLFLPSRATRAAQTTTNIF